MSLFPDRHAPGPLPATTADAARGDAEPPWLPRWAVLSALVGLHWVFDALLQTLAPQPREASGLSGNLIVGARLGVIFSQPALLTLVAAFWPGYAMLRIAASLALLAAMCQALIFAGITDYRRASPLESIVVPACIFVGCLIPSLALRGFRGWRFVLEEDRSLGKENRQFSMRALLICIGVICLLLAAARSTFSLVNWDSIGGIDAIVFAFMVFGSIGGAYWLTALPLVSAVLTDHPDSREWFWATWLPVIGVVATGAVFAVLFGSEGLYLSVALVGAAYVSISGTLLVLRFCGCRLVNGKSASRDRKQFREAPLASNTNGWRPAR
jgi:MFS family permease